MNLISDEKCFQMVRRLRWPEFRTCPFCDSRRTIKKGFRGRDIHSGDTSAEPAEAASTI
ncbi:MAG: transposase [Desulfococcaceae bacterium]